MVFGSLRYRSENDIKPAVEQLAVTANELHVKESLKSFVFLEDNLTFAVHA